MWNRRRRGGAFTLTQLMVVIGMLALLLAALFPVMTRMIESDRRTRCANNLRALGLAMKMYANNEPRTNAFPRAKRGKPDANNNVGPVTWASGNGGDGLDAPGSTWNPPGVSGGAEENDVTAALFLLMRTQGITAERFNCPATGATPFTIRPGLTVMHYTNWNTSGAAVNGIRQTLSYSYHNPYEFFPAVSNGFAFADAMTADHALMADINPGINISGDPLKGPLGITYNDSAEMQRFANSLNHDQVGQNVLYADGHVDWTASVWVGRKGDNIYTARRDAQHTSSNDTLAGPGQADLRPFHPVDRYRLPPDDSILLPTDD